MMCSKSLNGSFSRSKHSHFVADDNGCYLCWINFSNTEEWHDHMKCHLENVKVNGFNASWKSLGHQELLEFQITVASNQSGLTLNLKNQGNNIIKIKHVAIYNTLLTFDLVNPDVFPIVLETDDEVTLLKVFNKLCAHNHIVIVYDTMSNNIYEAVQSYQVQINPPMEVLDESIKRLTIASPNTRKSDGHLEVDVLSTYKPSVEIISLYNANFKQSANLTGNEINILKKISQFKGSLTPSNYFDMLTLMVQIEDYGSQLSVIRSTKRNRSLVKVKKNEFTLKLHHTEGRPLFLLAGDHIWIGKGNRDPKTHGVVQYVSSNEIQMKLRTATAIEQAKPLYSIHFEVNRLTFRLQRLALDNAKRLNIIDLLFPQRSQLDLLKKPTIPELDIHNKRLKGDANQMEAVHHIVAGAAYPLPYILIGYPGTGKTATIVESIYQIWKTNPNNKILVCAQSNSVCDEIAERLISAIPGKAEQKYNIIRLFAASVRKSCNNEDILENSNFEEGSIPCLAELYKYRIVVSTLTVSGRLLQANMNPKHFTHLFIDECESATEVFTLIPIALCSSKKNINAHVVLCGDPNQLGPVVRESVTKAMKMDISMFTRLCFSEVYRKNTKTKSYDPRVICKLRNNYRSHPGLVKMPNELFYNNEIICSTSLEKIQWMSELDFLPKRGFPILFEHVEGIPDKKEDCLSWFNDNEMESVLYYVDILLNKKSHKINPSDIGVIAAYKRQAIHISEALEEHNFSGIDVGTVEQFQGREKPIIIISTVRNGSLGFLKQRERINVLLTRAIGLMIIIGHVKSLKKNNDWKKIIEYTSNECGGELVAEYSHDVGDYRC